MLLDFCKKISLPDSPLDEIIDKLGGPSQVAEMTGRRGRIVRHSPNETPRYETRTADSDAYGAIDSLNVQEVGVTCRATFHKLTNLFYI
jgi:hypothetical protein